MKRITLLFVLTWSCYSLGLWGHTPDETNEVVHALLGRVRSFCSIDNLGKDLTLWQELCPNTWEKFLGAADANWTTEDRQGVFDWYLSTLGSANLLGRSKRDQDDVLCAISECILLTYTNAVPSLMSLALNTNGVYQEDAAKAALRVSPVNDTATEFVEFLTTNCVNVSAIRRGVALCEYGRKLRLSQQSNGLELFRAVDMFYRNRKSEITAAIGCDMVLTNFVGGYDMSSNRLDASLWALSDQEWIKGRYRDYFVTITNQLLSSGQPLRWINVGGTSE